MRIAELSYDAGMQTLTDVQGAQLGVQNAEKALSEGLLNYNLAVLAYELSSTVGSKASSANIQ